MIVPVGNYYCLANLCVVRAILKCCLLSFLASWQVLPGCNGGNNLDHVPPVLRSSYPVTLPDLRLPNFFFNENKEPKEDRFYLESPRSI